MSRHSLLATSAEFDRENLRVALIVLSDVEANPDTLLYRWAQAVVQRLQPQLELELEAA